MNKRILTEKEIYNYKQYLICEEKSEITIAKYIQDVKAFARYVRGLEITKELVMSYKQYLIEQYASCSVNSKLAALGSLFHYLGWEDCKVKNVKLQRKIYSAEDEELTKNEYMRLIEAAKRKPRLRLIIQTICGTGIRVSELQYFTLEAVRKGSVSVSCKNKTRNIFIPNKLQMLLLNYAKKQGIQSGVVFRTRMGNAVNRSNIWSDMKKLCKDANVNPKKVFPHNLRKLFARTFYGIEKDIAKLADILGHSSVDTTRIYLISTGREHRKRIERLGLVQ